MRMHTFVANEHRSFGVDVEQINDDATSEDYLKYRAVTLLPPDGATMEAVGDSWVEAVDALREALVGCGLL